MNCKINENKFIIHIHIYIKIILHCYCYIMRCREEEKLQTPSSSSSFRLDSVMLLYARVCVCCIMYRNRYRYAIDIKSIFLGIGTCRLGISAQERILYFPVYTYSIKHLFDVEIFHIFYRTFGWFCLCVKMCHKKPILSIPYLQ